MNTNVAQLKTALAQFIGEDRLIDDPLRTLAYGTDASFYRLIPQLVVKLVIAVWQVGPSALGWPLKLLIAIQQVGPLMLGRP